jgi:hypothetical protein
MASSAKAAELRSEQPALFEYREREQVFHVTVPSLGFPLVIPAATFFENIVNAVDCSRQHRPWDRPSAEIIDFAAHQAAISGRPSK